MVHSTSFSNVLFFPLDVNGDGLNELIVTLTDRVIRTYQWRDFAKNNVEEIGYHGENIF